MSLKSSVILTIRRIINTYWILKGKFPGCQKVFESLGSKMILIIHWFNNQGTAMRTGADRSISLSVFRCIKVEEQTLSQSIHRQKVVQSQLWSRIIVFVEPWRGLTFHADDRLRTYWPLSESDRQPLTVHEPCISEADQLCFSSWLSNTEKSPSSGGSQSLDFWGMCTLCEQVRVLRYHINGRLEAQITERHGGGLPRKKANKVIAQKTFAWRMFGHWQIHHIASFETDIR
jgi:hypothetical protein